MGTKSSASAKRPRKSVAAAKTVVKKGTKKVAKASAAPANSDNTGSSGNGAPDDFEVDDMLVYPGHGVGRVTAVKAKSIAGTEQRFLEILIVESGMKIMVPVVQAESVGIRRVVDKKAVDKVYNILKDRNFKIDSQTWNRRFREYSQKIKTGSVYEIAEVLRDLSVLSIDKELSFGEKKMLDMAQNLLVSEIAIAKARTTEKVMGEIQAIFN